jgi:hypothetical protein
VTKARYRFFAAGFSTRGPQRCGAFRCWRCLALCRDDVRSLALGDRGLFSKCRGRWVSTRHRHGCFLDVRVAIVDERYLRRVAKVVAVWFVLLIGCDRAGRISADATADAYACAAPVAPAEVVDACAHLATARCGQLEACSTTRFHVHWPDAETCREREQLACVLEHAAPNSGATAAATTACADALLAQTCAEFLAPTVVPPECFSRAGSLANEAVCDFSSQCQSAFCGLDGICRTLPMQGDYCRATNGEFFGCGPTLVCPVALDPKCAAPVGEGMLCRDSNNEEIAPCEYGFGCQANGHAPDYSGSCTPLATMAGDACGFGGGGALPGPLCDLDLGLGCAVVFGVGYQCMEIVFVSVGSACGRDRWCFGDATCSPSEAPTCVMSADDCAPCDSKLANACLYPARCKNDVCTLPRG